jgi:hypothetical protein
LTAQKDHKHIAVEITQLSGGHYHHKFIFPSKNVDGIIVFGSKSKDQIKLVGPVKFKVSYMSPGKKPNSAPAVSTATTHVGHSTTTTLHGSGKAADTVSLAALDAALEEWVMTERKRG